MSGNVYEWCWDWFGAYSSTAQTNPIGPSHGLFRVVRGYTLYFNYRGGCRVKMRDTRNAYPDYPEYDIGFRVVISY